MAQSVATLPLAEFVTDAIRLEEGANGQPRLSGHLAQVDVVNRNDRYYSRTVFEKAIELAQPAIEAGSFTGELDHPDFSVHGTLEKTAFVFDSISLNDDMVTFEARLLNTPAGATLKALLEGGVKVGMSTRGTATIKWKEPAKGESGPSIALIQDDFVLHGADAVKVPANEAGFIRFRESVENRIRQTLRPEREDPTVAITTIEELKQEFPELTQSLEEAVETAARKPLEVRVGELETALEEAKTSLEERQGELDSASADLEALRNAVVGENLEADPVQVLSDLRERVQTLESDLTTVTEERDRLQREDGLRRAFETSLEQSDFAAILREEIDPLSFADEDALTIEIARLEKLAKRVAGTPAPGRGKVESTEEPVEPEHSNPYINERTKRLAGITG